MNISAKQHRVERKKEVSSTPNAVTTFKVVRSQCVLAADSEDRDDEDDLRALPASKRRKLQKKLIVVPDLVRFSPQIKRHGMVQRREIRADLLLCLTESYSLTLLGKRRTSENDHAMLSCCSSVFL